MGSYILCPQFPMHVGLVTIFFTSCPTLICSFAVHFYTAAECCLQNCICNSRQTYHFVKCFGISEDEKWSQSILQNDKCPVELQDKTFKHDLLFWVPQFLNAQLLRRLRRGRVLSTFWKSSPRRHLTRGTQIVGHLNMTKHFWNSGSLEY